MNFRFVFCLSLTKLSSVDEERLKAGGRSTVGLSPALATITGGTAARFYGVRLGRVDAPGLPFPCSLTHILIQNGKKDIETMERRGLQRK